MRPYIAIVRDAFRAVMASYVLYTMLGLITLVLLVLSPLHLRESLDSEFSVVGLRSVQRDVARELWEKKSDDRYPVVQRIWSRLPAATQQAVEELQARSDETESPDDRDSDLGAVQIEVDSGDQSGSPPRKRGRANAGLRDLSNQLAKGLNEVLADRDFYEPSVWETVVVSGEAQSLLTEGIANLTSLRVQRLNRLLLSDALRSLPAPLKSVVKVYYAFFHLSFVPTDVNRAQIVEGLKSSLRFIFDKFVLSLGILIAIIVTASMVPETFEPGSLNLLLSKPISRVGLLLSKFVGGTAFTALCGCYLFLGTWLWMGLGLGTWDRSILWSIPLYVVVFAIYFSVSVAAGVAFRSPIVSVILTAVFWAFCFAVGTTYSFINTRVANDQLLWAGQFGEKYQAINKFGEPLDWEPSQKIWQAAGGPVETVEQEEQIAFAMIRYMADLPVISIVPPIEANGTQISLKFRPFPPGAFERPRLDLLSPTGSRRLIDVTGAIALLPTPAGPVLAFTDGRLWRLTPDAAEAEIEKVAEAAAADVKAKPAWPGGLGQELGPDSQRQMILEPSRVAADPVTGDIVSINGNRLSLYRWVSPRYQAVGQLELDLGTERSRLSSWIAFRNGQIVVAFGNSLITWVDAQKLQVVNSYRPELGYSPSSVQALENGEFWVVFRHGRVWSLNPQQPERMRLASVPFQGQIHGVSSLNQNEILICHSIDRVSTWNLSAQNLGTQLADNSDLLKNVYRWVVRPLYLICPKPSEFYRLVEHLSTNSDTASDATLDMRDRPVRSDPWSPLWSGLGFMLVTLCFSCWYFYRLDC